MDYTQHRQAVESLYEDRATVSRYVEIQTPAGETKLSEKPEVVYENQPCRLSQTQLAKNNQTEVQNDIQFEMKLFISPELDIRQGDIIEVTRRDGRKVTGSAGEPFPPYATHQELYLQRRAYA